MSDDDDGSKSSDRGSSEGEEGDDGNGRRTNRRLRPTPKKKKEKKKKKRAEAKTATTTTTTTASPSSRHHRQHHQQQQQPQHQHPSHRSRRRPYPYFYEQLGAPYLLYRNAERYSWLLDDGRDEEGNEEGGKGGNNKNGGGAGRRAAAAVAVLRQQQQPLYYRDNNTSSTFPPPAAVLHPEYSAPFAKASLVEAAADAATTTTEATTATTNEDDDDETATVATKKNKSCGTGHQQQQQQRRQRRRRVEPPASFDDPNGSNDEDDPRRFGNCLVAVPCPCPYCCCCRRRRRSSETGETTTKEDDDKEESDGGAKDGSALQPSPSPSWYLLYPTGPLLNVVRLSQLVFPRDSSTSSSNGKTAAEEAIHLDVGDGIRQLVKCGVEHDDGAYVARTNSQCTVFAIAWDATAAPPLRSPGGGSGSGDGAAATSSPPGGCRRCWGIEAAKLKQLHRIDLRSFAVQKPMPSYRPVDVACHPKYGRRSWTAYKIAILSESSIHGNEQRNVVHHVDASPRDATIARHAVANLQRISKIDFCQSHPMVLWAAARSYVRPALAGHYLSKFPRIGHGDSLFSIDLRTNRAAFQWSPSAEDYMVEGVHSVSGVATDWNKDHAVWVSSASAGRTWEIDARMPCRVVTAWSLPHACDGVGANLPATGFHGAGTLFSQPQYNAAGGACKIPLDHFPMLSVGLTPSTTFGIHLYQRPLVLPHFQTRSVECAAGPGLAFLKDTSIAASSVFVLPDVSRDVFTCGLAPIPVPASRYLSPEDLATMGFHDRDSVGPVLCSVTMTNKGDLYVNSLLESRASFRRSQIDSGLPVGSAAIPLPTTLSNLELGQSPLPSRPSRFRVRLVNELPLTSSAITFKQPLCESATAKALSVGEQKDATNRINPRSRALGICSSNVEPDTGATASVLVPSRLCRGYENDDTVFDDAALSGKQPPLDKCRSDVTREFMEESFQ